MGFHVDKEVLAIDMKLSVVVAYGCLFPLLGLGVAPNVTGRERTELCALCEFTMVMCVLPQYHLMEHGTS